MKKIHAMLAAVAVATAALLAVVATPSAAWAADKVVLKDGKVLEGTIVREDSGYVWIKVMVGGVEQQKMLSPDEYSKIERESSTPAPKADAPAKPSEEKPAQQKVADEKKSDATPAVPAGDSKKKDEKEKAKPDHKRTPKAAVLTLGDHRGGMDMVGVYLTKYGMEQADKILEQELGTDGTGVLVLRVSSGGGYLLEIQNNSDYIHNVLKKKYRVVGWIDSAISAAAMSTLCIEEIYFTPQGNFGACTGWSGNLVAVKGIGLVQVLQMMEKISARGGYDPKIMRSMQIQEPLSLTIDDDGTQHFYQNASDGKILVNRPTEILTLNSETAKQIGFSRGTASNIEELTKLMGYQELEWIGDKLPGVLWPVSKAEKWTMDWRKKTKEGEDRTQEYFQRFQMQMEAAAAAPRAERAPFVGRARQTLEQIKAMVRSNPAFMLTAFNTLDKEEYDKRISDIEKQLRDLMK